jgi:hypothetical protein
MAQHCKVVDIGQTVVTIAESKIFSGKFFFSKEQSGKNPPRVKYVLLKAYDLYL